MDAALSDVEGEVSDVEAGLLQDVLRLAEQDPSLEVDRIDATPGCSHGDNYMSTVTRVHVTGTRKRQQEAYKKSVVIKRQPTSKVYRDFFNCGVFFLNEKATYYEVIPAFQRFSKNSRPLPYPKCLHATEEMIVLQDLKPAGFKMSDRLKGLDFEHCKLVFQELAGFHAISLAMKRKDPEKFKTVRESIHETMYVPANESLFDPSLANAFKIALFALRSMSSDDPSLLAPIRLLENVNKNLFKRMAKLVRPREPFAVINHGDCWINNFLFKYHEDKSVDQVRLLDLQVTRYASPVIDILHFLYTSTHEDVRRKHFDALLVVYHTSLVESLRRLLNDVRAGDMFTLGQLKNEMKVHAMYGLINGLWLLPAVTVDASTLPELDDLAKDDLYSQENVDHWIAHQTQDYKDRTRHLVLEYIERGFL